MNEKNCKKGVTIAQIPNECDGNYLSTSCVQTPNSISYLDLAAGSNQTQINAALVSSLIYKDQQINDLEVGGTSIQAGENITIEGDGSEDNPYIVSSSSVIDGFVDLTNNQIIDGEKSFIEPISGVNATQSEHLVTLSQMEAADVDVLQDAKDYSDSIASDENYTISEKTKLSFITITQAVDLDDLETRVNDLDAAVVLKGTWDASVGTFPGASVAQAGWSYLVNVDGTVDGIEFRDGDRLICVLNNASTSIYAGNWYKADYTDRVNTVAGRTGNVVITSSDLSDFNSAVNALITTAISGKQDTLVSGVNIKTINGNSILGSGDLIVSGGSTTPLEKTIKNYISQQQGSEYYTKWIEKKTVFTGGDNIAGTNVNTLRIPSIEHFSNGDLCMAAEARIANGDDDTPAGIAIYKIRQGIVVDKKIILPISGEYKLANPQLLRVNTKMYLFYSSFNASFTPNTTNEIKLYYTTSVDNGDTWSTRVEFLGSDQDTSSLFKYLTSPGNSIYHSSDKILIPIWGRYVNDAAPNTRVGMVIWDLKTNTFSKSLISGYAGGSEPALIEDTNGDVYSYFRVIGSDVKGVYYTSDMGSSWSAAISNNKFAEQCFSSLRKFQGKIFRTETMVQGVDGTTRYDMVLLRADSVNDTYDMITHVTPKGLNVWGYGGTSLFANEFAIVSEDKPNLVISYLKVEGLNRYQNIIGEPYSPYSYKPDDSIFSSSLFQIDDTSSQVNVYEQDGRLVFEDISTASISGNAKLKSDPIVFNINERDLFFYIDIEKNNDSFFQALNLSSITPDPNNQISFRTNDSDSNFARLRVVTAGVTVDDTSTEVLSGQFKVSIIGSSIKVYKWLSNSWTLILENTNMLFTNYQVQVLRAVSATSGEKTYLDNFIITNYDWIGKIPVKAD